MLPDRRYLDGRKRERLAVTKSRAAADEVIKENQTDRKKGGLFCPALDVAEAEAETAGSRVPRCDFLCRIMRLRRPV